MENHDLTKGPFLNNVQIGGRWNVVRKIGSGAFGDVFVGITNYGDEVAIKIESTDSRHPQLEHEFHMYRILSGGFGIPQIKHYGTEYGYNVLVMNMLGPSLEDLLNFCGRKFTLKTILMLADQMIGRLEFVHTKQFIHRDVKPDNFLIGLGSNLNKLFLIDFGLAKSYQDSKTIDHTACGKGRMAGTARYASINTHVGCEQSRRDDLESLAYVFVYFSSGILPWQGLKASTKGQKYEKIAEKKMSVSVEKLCEGLPNEFTMFLKYCRELGFDETPDYLYLRQIFRILFSLSNYSYDYIFDWTLIMQKKGKLLDNTDSAVAQVGTQQDINDRVNKKQIN